MSPIITMPQSKKATEQPPEEEPIYERGKNPASLQNLTFHKGRPKVRDTWGEDPGSLTTSCTPTAKKGLPDALKTSGYTSLAELLEYLGRGLITLPEKPEPPKL